MLQKIDITKPRAWLAKDELQEEIVSTLNAVIDHISAQEGETVKGERRRLIEMVKVEERERVLDIIAQGEGWEDSRDHYAEILGVPKIYKK